MEKVKIKAIREIYINTLRYFCINCVQRFGLFRIFRNITRIMLQPGRRLSLSSAVADKQKVCRQHSAACTLFYIGLLDALCASGLHICFA